VLIVLRAQGVNNVYSVLTGFEVGTAMGLGNMNHSVTGSKQKHTDTKSFEQYNGARCLNNLEVKVQILTT